MVDVAGQHDLLVLYEKEVRRSCGIDLSSNSIVKVPRITNRSLPDAVQANIARLQNTQIPLVRRANRQLDQITVKLSRVTAGEFTRATEEGPDPFKRKFPDLTPFASNKLFAPPSPKRTTISVEQYRRKVAKQFESPSTPVEGTEATLSSSVPIQDLNIDSDELYGELNEHDPKVSENGFATIRPTVLTFAKIALDAGTIPIGPRFDSLPLQDNLFESGSEHGSFELSIGLDTEDELLRSDPEDDDHTPRPVAEIIEPTVKSVVVKIDRARIQLAPEISKLGRPSNEDLESITIVVPEESHLPGTKQWRKYQRYEFDDYRAGEITPALLIAGNTRRRQGRMSPPRSLPLPENRIADADLCDTDTDADALCPTPLHPSLEPYLTQLPTATAGNKRLNRSMKQQVLQALLANRTAVSTSEDQVVPHSLQHASRLRPELERRLGSRQ